MKARVETMNNKKYTGEVVRDGKASGYQVTYRVLTGVEMNQRYERDISDLEVEEKTIFIPDHAVASIEWVS